MDVGAAAETRDRRARPPSEQHGREAVGHDRLGEEDIAASPTLEVTDAIERAERHGDAGPRAGPRNLHVARAEDGEAGQMPDRASPSIARPPRRHDAEG